MGRFGMMGRIQNAKKPKIEKNYQKKVIQYDLYGSILAGSNHHNKWLQPQE